jgi:pimeloyl-ACP methyl ester carboxylesterase
MFLHKTSNINIIEQKLITQQCKKKINSFWITLIDEYNEEYKIHSLRIPNENKPTLLLIHGLNSGSIIWLPILDELSNYFDILVVDLPGFGRSDTPNSLYFLEYEIFPKNEIY